MKHPLRSCGQRLSSAEGTTVVEMAISCTILFAMLFGIIEVSLALYTYDYVVDAARQGARYAIVRGSECRGFADCNASKDEIGTYIKGLRYPGIDPDKMTVSAAWYAVTLKDDENPTTHTYCGDAPIVGTVHCDAPGNEVQVQVVYSFPLAIPFWRSTQLSLASTAELVISQ